MAVAVALETADLLCPQCGYDLRGIESERCPECGLAFDRADTISRLPWSYRRQRGRVRAYLATARLVILRPRDVLHEVARPVSYRDARRFWIVSSAIISLPMLSLAGFCFWAVSQDKLSSNLQQAYMATPLSRGLAWDILAPTVVGWMFTPLIAVLVVVATFCCNATLPFWLNRKTLPMPHRARAVSLGYYASAAMLLWPTLTVLLALGIAGIVLLGSRRAVTEDAVLMVLVIGGEAVFGLSILLTMIRAAGFYRVLGRGGVRSWFIGAALLPLTWLTILFFWLVAVPWAIGACWLLVRGLR